MKNLKVFEDFDDFDGTEDDRKRIIGKYLNSPEYFIETYYNGNYSQLKTMLAKFKSDDRMGELIDWMDQSMDSSDAGDLKNWMLKN